MVREERGVVMCYDDIYDHLTKEDSGNHPDLDSSIYNDGLI